MMQPRPTAPTRPALPAQRPGLPLAPVAPSRKDFSAMLRKGPSKIGARLYLVGQDGIGKSTAGSELPNPLFLCGEDGLVGPQFEQTQSLTPSSWEELLEMADWFASTDNEWLVLDTLDWVEPLVFSYVVRRDSTTQRPLKNIEDYGYGKGYSVAADEFRRLLVRFDAATKVGKNIMVLAHCHIKTFNNPLGDNYDRYEAQVCKQIDALMRQWVDATLFAHFDGRAVKDRTGKAKGVGGEGRVLECVQSAGWNAKNRYGLPNQMPFEILDVLPYIAAPQASADDAAQILTEIEEMIPLLSPDDAAKCRAAIVVPGKSEDAGFLTRLRNATRLRIPTETTTEGEN